MDDVGSAERPNISFLIGLQGANIPSEASCRQMVDMVKANAQAVLDLTPTEWRDLALAARAALCPDVLRHAGVGALEHLETTRRLRLLVSMRALRISYYVA
jgi:hypothetical protein